MIPVAFHSQLFRLCILRQNAQNGGRVIRLCSHIYIGGCANTCSECAATCHHSRQCARNQAHHDFFRFHGNPSLRSVLTVFLVSLCIQCSIFVCYLQQHVYNSSTTKRLHLLRSFLRNKKKQPVRIARAAAYCGSLGDDKNTACRIGDDIKHYLGDDNCALNKIGILSGSCVST